MPVQKKAVVAICKTNATRDKTRDALDGTGHNAFCFSNFGDAIEFIQEKNPVKDFPDLILVESGMDIRTMGTHLRLLAQYAKILYFVDTSRAVTHVIANLGVVISG